MSDRREALLRAATAVLAQRGARQLTHRAVDRRAGLPLGSASNVFRTRAALIDGVLGHLIDDELANLPALAGAIGDAPLDEALLVELCAQAIVHALGPGRELTLARRALFQEAAQDPRVRDRLERSSTFWWTTLADLLRGAGGPDPDRRARLLLAYVDGVISDQLARPQEGFDPRGAIVPAVRGVLGV